MDDNALEATIRRFLSGDVSLDDTVRAMLPLADKHAGLAMTYPATPEQRVQLNHLGKALSWEMGKKRGRGLVPDVPYGSAEYHAFLKNVPRSSNDPASAG